MMLAVMDAFVGRPSRMLKLSGDTGPPLLPTGLIDTPPKAQFALLTEVQLRLVVDPLAAFVLAVPRV